MKKDFKIGEYVVGGIIRAEVDTKNVVVRFLDWNTKEPIVSIIVRPSEGISARRKLSEFMNENGTYYYSEKVLEWIESKVEFKSMMDW